MTGDHVGHRHRDALVLTTIQRGFNNPTFSDLTIRSRTFFCHKLILSSRGEGEWLKDLENRSHLDYSSLEDAAVSRLLKWIYVKDSLVSSSDSKEFVLEILEATKLFELTSAREECEKFFYEKINIQQQIKEVVGDLKGRVQPCGFCQGCL